MRKWKHLLRTAVILGLVIGLMLVPATSVYAANDISITLPYSSMDEGATFTMNVVIDSITDFDAMVYDVVATPDDVVDLTSVDAGEVNSIAIPIITPTPVKTNDPGVSDTWRVVSNVSDTPGVTGGGYFAVLNFTVTGSDADTVVITLENGTVSDKDAAEITCNWTGTGTLTIDLLGVTAIGVVGEGATNEGYINDTLFTMTPTVSGGTGGYTYAWDFGTDGAGSSTAAVPSDVVYSSTGGKTITLRVTDDLSSTSEGNEQSGSATIYGTLVAGFSGDSGNTEAQKGIVKWGGSAWETTTNYSSTVDFDSSATTGGETPYIYSWDFDNDTTEDSTAANPADFDYATFANDVGATFEGADYTVVLEVDDSLTEMDDETKASYITLYVAGDINGTLTLDATDVTAIELIVAFEAGNPETFTSDANDDGDVNALDITQTEIILAA